MIGWGFFGLVCIGWGLCWGDEVVIGVFIGFGCDIWVMVGVVIVVGGGIVCGLGVLCVFW